MYLGFGTDVVMFSVAGLIFSSRAANEEWHAFGVLGRVFDAVVAGTRRPSTGRRG